MTDIKRSHLAGTWYAGETAALATQVDDLLESVDVPNEACLLRGIVVPHAGYRYSGRAAAAAYTRLRGGPYTRAVILAPSHFTAFRGVAMLEVDAFETPLGQVAVDRHTVTALAASPGFIRDPQPFAREHALEIQLPLLQRVLPAVTVVPLLLGELTAADEAAIAAELRTLLAPQSVFIVSSDFVHYGWRFGYMPFPADGPEPVRTQLRELDMGAITRVCAGDAGGFARYVNETGATICGHTAIAAFLRVHHRESQGTLLTYYTSLDVTGDYEHCVSYASIAFPQP